MGDGGWLSTNMPRIIDRFTASLDRLAVDWTRVEVEQVSELLAEIVVPPAVGAPLPFENMSFDDVDLSLDPTPAELQVAQTGVTTARFGIAEYGTVVIESAPNATEAVSLFPEKHVAVLRASDLVADMKAAFEHLGPILRETGGSAVLATGPSATADMGALVRGAHGPKEVHVLIVDSQ